MIFCKQQKNCVNLALGTIFVCNLMKKFGYIRKIMLFLQLKFFCSATSAWVVRCCASSNNFAHSQKMCMIHKKTSELKWESNRYAVRCAENNCVNTQKVSMGCSTHFHFTTSNCVVKIQFSDISQTYWNSANFVK
jgi:hypothetical protein